MAETGSHPNQKRNGQDEHHLFHQICPILLASRQQRPCWRIAVTLPPLSVPAPCRAARGPIVPIWRSPSERKRQLLHVYRTTTDSVL